MDSVASLLPDESLLVRRAADEPAAFTPLYDYYFPRVYNYVRYRVRDAALADDLTALIFERALAHLDSYRPERAPFGAWLFSIAHHVVGDHFRYQNRRIRLPFDFLKQLPSAEAPPEEAAAVHDTNQRLLEAVAQLSDRERDLIALKFAAGLQNRQIAELTGLSESNVAVILYRALRQLRTLLKDEEIKP